MKLKVDKDVCIGCGACQAVAPEVFEIDGDGLAKAIDSEIKEELIDDALDAKEGCPVDAISKVDDDTKDCKTNDGQSRNVSE